MVVALMTQRRGYYNSSTLKASTRSGDVFWCCVSHSAIRFLISSAKIGKSLVENYCLHILYI